MKNEKEDLSIGGPGTPISLDKFLNSEHNTERPITVLVDGSGMGIAKDAPGIMYITPEECKTQALYYRDEIFSKNDKPPMYLLKYLLYLYKRTPEIIKEEGDLIYKSWVSEGHVTWFRSLMPYLEHNPELMQCIGLIQLTCGTLAAAKKQNKSIKLYFEHPETHLHPAKQSAFMTVIHTIMEEYGIKQ